MISPNPTVITNKLNISGRISAADCCNPMNGIKTPTNKTIVPQIPIIFFDIFTLKISNCNLLLNQFTYLIFLFIQVKLPVYILCP